MKQIKHFLLTVAMLLCSTFIFAHDFEVDGIYYGITSSADKTVAVTYRGYSFESYSNEYSGSVTIPESVTYNGTTYSVTIIGGYAFYYCKGLTSVTIPNSVTSIGNSAFEYCSGLTSIEIPNSVTSIGGWAFFGCSGLTSVIIPNSVTSIGDYAFRYCSGLTSIEIPNSVTSIGWHAFTDCYGLTSVTIPNSVTSIGNYAFYRSGLTSVEIPNSVTSIGEFAFTDCNNLTSIIVDDENTTYDSRDNCNAIIETETNELIVGSKSTIIPNSVTSIGIYAFYKSGLTSVTIPNSVTSIGNSAFEYCSGLTSIEIPNSVTSIGRGAFKNCSGLTSIIVDDENTTYDSRDNCNAIIETSSNTLIVGCKSTIIPNSVTSIGNYAFYRSGLTSISIPNSVTSIGIYAFFDCSGLTSIEIPNSVTSIEICAFSGCSGLTSVTIGNSVTSIENYAFEYCSGLKSITSYIPAEKLFTPQTSGFEGVDKTGCILYVPKGAKEKYATTDGWKDFMNIVEILETYKVTFVVDGEVFATDSVTEGNSLVFPNVPEKEGYTFLGWSEAPETMPANDITITGEWSINSYLVTFIIDGEVYATDSVEYGAAITLPEVPEKENSTFEWEEAPETMPASDVTIYGNYVSGIGGITVTDKVDVYTMNGMLYKRDVDLNKLNIELPKGVYIINGKKYLVK